MADVYLDQRTNSPRFLPAELRGFIEAVHDLSDDPGPANVDRYLAASRALEVGRREQSALVQSEQRFTRS